MSRNRVVLAVCLGWVLIALINSAQASIGAALMPAAQAPPPSVVSLVRSALISALPWIPMTLAAIVLTLRFPIGRVTWRRHIGIHIAAGFALAVVANALTVLGVWTLRGTFGSVRELASSALLWSTVRLNVVALAYAAVVAITQTMRLRQRARARELDIARVEAQLARAHVQALNAQMRPHFLFNTLHTIGQLWRSGESDEADAVLDHLGALFQKVHASTSRATITLADELAIVREYLATEEARYRDRLRVDIAAPESVLDCLVPPLILQPIVENAVRHGIAAMSSAGRITVIAEPVGETLRLRVHDDGPGFVNSHRPGGGGSGMGLRNTTERLVQMYGPEATLRIDGDGGGTTVTIVVPLSSALANAS